MFVIREDVDPNLADAIAATVGCSPSAWPPDAPAPWCQNPAEVVVLAIGDGEAGERALRELRAQAPRCRSLVVMPDAASPALVRAVADIADDFVIWPVRPAELTERIHRLWAARARAKAGTRESAGAGRGSATAEIASVSRRLQRSLPLCQMIGEAPAFRRMVDALPRFAQQDGTVLIVGETGTGKELCARAIHQLGPTPGGPFVAVDCGALPDQLLENELFGHARGAFTDARHEQRGLVGLADGGVLFLDEVDALSPAAQAKLLRFLQEHSYRPLGSDRLIQANVRVVAATNAELPALVRAGRFRADLHYRLNVLRIDVVPLRERRSDIALLAEHFLKRAGGQDGGRRRLSAAALDRLARHDWPGNVRELENVIRRALVLVPPGAGEIGLPDVDLDGSGALPSPPETPTPAARGSQTFRAAKAQAVAEFERRFVSELLQRHQGNITQAARAAHKDRRALGRLVKKYPPAAATPATTTTTVR